MPSLPISGLTAGNPAQSSDLLPMERSGVTYYVTAGSIAALGSTSVPSGTNIMPGNTFTGQSGQAGANNTYMTQFPGAAVMTPSPSGCKVGMSILLTGPLKIGQMTFFVTAVGSDVVISSTAVTIGGQASPSVTIPGGTSRNVQYTFLTDTIAVSIDNQHDYYFVIFLINDVSNTNTDAGICTASVMPTRSIGSGNQTPTTTMPTNLGANQTGSPGKLVYALVTP